MPCRAGNVYIHLVLHSHSHNILCSKIVCGHAHMLAERSLSLRHVTEIYLKPTENKNNKTGQIPGSYAEEFPYEMNISLDNRFFHMYSI